MNDISGICLMIAVVSLAIGLWADGRAVVYKAKYERELKKQKAESPFESTHIPFKCDRVEVVPVTVVQSAMLPGPISEKEKQAYLEVIKQDMKYDFGKVVWDYAAVEEKHDTFDGEVVVRATVQVCSKRE